MRYKEIAEDDASKAAQQQQQTTQPDDNEVAKAEQRIIAKARKPVRGRQFRTLDAQSAYLRKMLR